MKKDLLISIISTAISNCKSEWTPEAVAERIVSDLETMGVLKLESEDDADNYCGAV